jgi:hypothetical protein
VSSTDAMAHPGAERKLHSGCGRGVGHGGEL